MGNTKYLENYKNAVFIANAFSKKGDYAQAIAYLKKELDKVKEINDEEIESIILNDIGSIYLKKKDYDTALQYRKKALSMRLKLGDNRAIAESYNDVGVVYHNMRNFAEAVKFYEQALKYCEKVKDNNLLAVIYNNMGLTNYSLGNYNKAKQFYLKAISIYKTLPSTEKVIADILFNLASAFYMNEELDEAISYYNKTLELYDKLADNNQFYHCQYILGNIYYEKKDYQTALTLFKSCEKALKKFDPLGYKEVQDMINKINSMGKVRI